MPLASRSPRLARRAAPLLVSLAALSVAWIASAQEPPPADTPPAGSAPAPTDTAAPTDSPSTPPPASTPTPPASTAPPPPTAPPSASAAPARTAAPPASTAPARTAAQARTPPDEPAPRRDDRKADSKGDDKKDDKKDDERGWEWLWLAGEGGLQYLSLTTLKSSGTLTPGVEKNSGTGPMGGLTAGVRLWILTVGLRARVASLPSFTYWSLDPEASIRFGTQSIQPYLLFGVGYSALGSFDSSSITSQAGAKIRGFNVRAGFGLDYYVTHTISLGALGTAEITAMTRPGVSSSDFQLNSQINGNTSDPNKTKASAEAARTEAETKAAKVDGSGVGLALAATLVLGLHF